MNHEAAVSNAKDIADRVLAPAARQNDKDGRFSSEAIKALGPAGLLGIMLPADVGGSALGPRTFAAIVGALAEADASVAMVYLMHVCAAATIAAARKDATAAPTLKEIAAGRHLSTLAFSEAGSRSHFWAPVSRARRNAAGVHITAKKSFVTSAGEAHSYVVSALAPEGAGPTDSTLYLNSARRARPVGGGRLGRPWFAGQRFRADDSRGL
jgi:alkylation response protein AidB-like acyl-CoA dehydrogenase